MSILEEIYQHIANPPSFCLCHFFASVEYMRARLEYILERMIYG